MKGLDKVHGCDEDDDKGEMEATHEELSDEEGDRKDEEKEEEEEDEN